MKIKTTTFLTAAIVIGSAPLNVSAAPLVSIGDSATIHFNGSASTYWTSNLFRDETNEVDDLVLTLTPGLELQYGNDASTLLFGGTVNYEVRSYADRTELDQNLLLINTYASYEATRLTVNADAGFNEEQTNSGSANVVGTLIEAEVTTASIDAEYDLSAKIKFGAGFSYLDRDYLTATAFIADYSTYSVPLDVYYELTPKLDLSAGFTYTDRDIEALDFPGVSVAYDTQTYFYNVGLRGDLLPKLSGTAKVGYRERERDGFGSTGSLGVDVNLTWATTAKLTNRILLGRDFGVAGDGSTTEETSFLFASSFAFTPQYSASSKVGYVLRDFQDVGNREDEQYELGLSFGYTPNEYWSFSAGYTYSETDSNAVNQSYDENRISLTASLRY